MKTPVQGDYFLIKLAKFDIAPFFTEHLWWLAIGLQLYNRPNTVYLKDTGRLIQEYTLPYSKLLSNTPSWKNNIPK